MKWNDKINFIGSYSVYKVYSHQADSKHDLKWEMGNVSIVKKVLESWASLFSPSVSCISSSPKQNYSNIKGKPPQTIAALDCCSI